MESEKIGICRSTVHVQLNDSNLIVWLGLLSRKFSRWFPHSLLWPYIHLKLQAFFSSLSAKNFHNNNMFMLHSCDCMYDMGHMRIMDRLGNRSTLVWACQVLVSGWLIGKSLLLTYLCSAEREYKPPLWQTTWEQ